MTVFHTKSSANEKTVFHTVNDTCKLETLLVETIGPKTFHLHHTVGGPGWCILNTAKTIKTVVIDNLQLATLVMLKLR